MKNPSHRELYRLVKDQVLSYDRYQSGELKVIGLPGFPRTDCIVNHKLSYAEWVNSYHNYPTAKVEGIESMTNSFKKLSPNDIHLFVSNKTSYSFKWHTDDVNVYLYVLRGSKRLQVKNKTIILTAGQGAFIPKGHLHRVFSKKNTWALSVGF